MNKESFVLVDSSAARVLPDQGRVLTAVLYPLSSYRQFDPNFLKTEIRCGNSFYYCVRQDNVWTIPEVCEEISGLVEIIHAKHKLLENHSREVQKKKSPRRYRLLRDSRQDGCIQRDLFFEWYELIKEIRRSVMDSFFIPQDKAAYQSILDIVCALEKGHNLKSEYLRDKGYHRSLARSPKKELKTDEKLVAAALYRSLIKMKPSAIICKDKHFKELLGGCRKLFAQDMPFNKCFLSRFIEHPITLYEYAYIEKMFCSSTGLALIEYVPKQFNPDGSEEIAELRKQVSSMLYSLGRRLFPS